MAVLRTWAEVQAFDGGLTKTEKKLADKCKAGEPCRLGPDCPTEASAARTIRAEVLRYFLLGGCKAWPVDGRGVDLRGAFVKGRLDLSFAKTRGATRLRACHFDTILTAEQTHFDLLDLSGSTVRGLFAQVAEITGHFFLDHITATATIDVNSTTVGGSFVCIGAELNVPAGTALNVHSSNIFGGVFLHPTHSEEKRGVAVPFAATGDVNFSSTTMGGFYAEEVSLDAADAAVALSLTNIICKGPAKLDGATITGETILYGAHITGDLTVEKAKFTNDKGHAFNGQRIRVDQSFVWKKVQNGTGAVSLNGAHVAELDDHPDNWPDRDALHLDGFTYDRIRGKVSTSRDRMAWLENGSYFEGEFRPQPYSQYAKFLRDTGHDDDARNVLATREKLRRASQRAQFAKSGHPLALPINLWMHFWDLVLRYVVGYGHRPFNSVIALCILITIAVLPAHLAWEEGSFAPNSAVVQTSPGWLGYQFGDNPAAAWSGDNAPGQDWETFNAFAYGVDVVIPIINFGQTEAWAPSTTRGRVGWHLWWGRWVLTSFGWIVTALGAAAITGIIRRE